MSKLTVTSSTVVVECTCGEQIEFDDVHDGWQHIIPCFCGEYVSIQFDDPILQFDRGPRPSEVRP